MELKEVFRISGQKKTCWEGKILLANPLATLYGFKISFMSYNLKYAVVDISLDNKTETEYWNMM